MIVSSLLDYIILAIPFKALDEAWMANFTTQIVDRGIIPMVGIALLLAGYWIGSSLSGGSSEPRSLVQDLRFWALILSSILGLIFLLLIPLYARNIQVQSTKALQRIDEQAKVAETQLESQAQQFDALLKNPDQLGQVEQRLTQQLQAATQSGQVPPEQLAQAQDFMQQLEALKKNPKALTQRVAERQTEIRSKQLEAKNQAQTEALKLGIRTGLSSLLLAIGYSLIGWMGLRSLGN